MKREQIQHLIDQEVVFQGNFVRYGFKFTSSKYRNRGDNGVVTMLFENVFIDGIYVDHIWVNDGFRLRKKLIKEGSSLKFTCTVKVYPNGTGFGIDKKRHINLIKEGNGKTIADYVQSLVQSGVKFDAQYDQFADNKDLSISV